MKRGELWWLDLGEPVGSAPDYERPCIIASADHFNRSALNTVSVVLVYSNLRLARHPGNVLLPASDTGLNRDSVASVTQIGTVDLQQLDRNIGVLPPSLMCKIDDGLRLALQL